MKSGSTARMTSPSTGMVASMSPIPAMSAMSRAISNSRGSTVIEPEGYITALDLDVLKPNGLVDQPRRPDPLRVG